MKKKDTPNKLVLSRETLHSLNLREVVGGISRLCPDTTSDYCSLACSGTTRQ